MRALLFATLFTAPMAAFAACPTVTDLDTGIRLDLASGEWEIFKTYSETVVETRFHYDADNGIRNLLYDGVYLLEFMDFDSSGLIPGTRSTYTYAVSMNEAPDPTPGTSWETMAVAYDGIDSLTESLVYLFQQPETVQLGDCRYDMIPIILGYATGDGEDASVDTIHYLPDLKISYLAASEGPDHNDVYDYVSLRLADP